MNMWIERKLGNGRCRDTAKLRPNTDRRTQQLPAIVERAPFYKHVRPRSKTVYRRQTCRNRTYQETKLLKFSDTQLVGTVRLYNWRQFEYGNLPNKYQDDDRCLLCRALRPPACLFERAGVILRISVKTDLVLITISSKRHTFSVVS